MSVCVAVDSEFEVDSLNFPGQVHRWRLSQLLQKGTLRAHDSLLNVRSLYKSINTSSSSSSLAITERYMISLKAM